MLPRGPTKTHGSSESIVIIQMRSEGGGVADKKQVTRTHPDPVTLNKVRTGLVAKQDVSFDI